MKMNYGITQTCISDDSMYVETQCSMYDLTKKNVTSYLLLTKLYLLISTHV